MDCIEKIRKEKEISVAELCSKIGVQRTTYYKWLDNSRKPKIDKVYKMCEVLEIDFKNIVEKFI